MDAARLRSLALIGALGGFIMLLGDYLFFLTPWVSGSDFDSMTAMYDMPPQRLIWGGIAGPIAGLAYGAGSCLFYLALKEHNKLAAFLISACFILTYALSGAAHGVFTVHGFLGPHDPAHIQPLITQMIDEMAKIIVVAALLGTILFIYMVLRYKTVFPKWVLLLTPALISAFKPVIAPIVPSPFGSIIIGGWPNWAAVIFFLCLAFLWRKKVS